MVKVLIKRRYKPGKEKEVAALLNEFRAGAMNRPGYISGITLINAEDTNVRLVIGTWESMEAWQAWKESDTRRTFDKMIAVYQEGPTQYETYFTSGGKSA
jgi:heme-degrading monooxygenase HmoA